MRGTTAAWSKRSWDTHRWPRLHDWLAGRLTHDYPALRAADLGPDLPRTLAVRGHVLAVLDGMDELPTEARTKVVTALNRYIGYEAAASVAHEALDTGETIRSVVLARGYVDRGEISLDELNAALNVFSMTDSTRSGDA